MLLELIRVRLSRGLFNELVGRAASKLHYPIATHDDDRRRPVEVEMPGSPMTRTVFQSRALTAMQVLSF